MISDNTVCILCKKTPNFVEIAKRVRDSEKHCVIRCSSCDHVQIWPIPNNQENKKFYDENRQPKNLGINIELEALRKRQFHDTKRRAQFLTNFIPRGSSILEVGSSYGFLLEELCKNGYKAEGVEISQERCRIAKQVTQASVFNIDLMKEPNLPRYQVVIMSHVLEHISDPIQFCSLLQQYLKEDGCVIAEVPNLNDLMLTSSSSYQSFWWQVAHLSYFSEKTLRHVFVQAGYRNIQITGIQRYGIDNMMDWMVRGKPQLDSPTFETCGSYKWLEEYYKSYLEENRQCDTLIAVAK